MGIPVLILGESGSGKSTSLRNMDPAKTVIMNVSGKPLPFKKKFPMMAMNASYERIFASLQKHAYKRYVIDDSQYLMAFEFFDRAKEIGYGKFTDIATQFTNLLRFVLSDMPQDCIVYFLHHVNQTESGRIKAKTIGKMIDEKMAVEGLSPVVLLCQTDGTEHVFITQSDGFTTAKSPMEMFPNKINNDLNLVDECIRHYYEFKEENTNETD